MNAFVLIQMALLRESLGAELASVRLLVVVNAQVLLQSAAGLEPLSALITRVRTDHSALDHVTFQLKDRDFGVS